MSQHIPSLVSTYQVLRDLYVGAGSRGLIRARAVDFIRPKQTTIWPCEEKALHHSASLTHGPCFRSIQLSLSQILQGLPGENEFNRARPMGVKKVELVFFHEEQALIRLTTRMGVWTPLQSCTPQSVADSSQTS